MKTAYNAFLPTKRGTLSDTQFRSLYSPYSDGVACIQAYWAYAIGVFYYATHRPMDEFTWQPFAVYAYRINNINLLQTHGAKIEALRLFTDKTSQAQILVANINIMATGVNLHDACRVGVIVSQHFNPKTNLQIHGRLNRLGQKPAVVWHCLKVKDSFHDHQDRVMLTKWARQLPAESNVKSWLSGVLREMFLFEIMKTYANLVDPEVLMVKMKVCRL
ncbi:hypothetical protein HDV62DRAFT_389184 [Trichoderma sp. SZMC 28011]